MRLIFAMKDVIINQWKKMLEKYINLFRDLTIIHMYKTTKNVQFLFKSLTE